jgi:hypothetical protein
MPAPACRIFVRSAPTGRQMPRKYGGAFTGKLYRHTVEKGSWYFVQVPERLAPPVTHAWGRTPVRATVGGHEWNTSVWRDKQGRTLLAVPAAVRGSKDHGDTVRVRLTFRAL